ncbi:extracellular solute-binding protein [Christensenella intestinihominis]|uniref:extracellular solute-binding protein n=1 Tax=Christensenella intestinihominis TaxID=1851429 RepID=UPI00082999F2|nr:extracellular solute-binding protein [Christensenella intestinihominis]
MKKVIALVLVLVLVAACASCGAPTGTTTTTPEAGQSAGQSAEETGGSASAEAQDGDIVLKYWITPAMANEADMQTPEEDWFIVQKIHEFEEANPGVKIDYTVITDDGSLPQMFKAAAMTNDCPDIINVWSGNTLFQLEDLVVDLTDLISKDTKDNMVGWDATTLAKDGQEKILAYPTSGNEINGFFYNKQILADCGLDYDKNPPADLDAFLKDLQTIKDKGYTPVYAADSGWSKGYLSVFAAYWQQISGKDRIVSDGGGEASFTDDEGFLQSFKIPADMYANGLMNADYASVASADDKAEFLIGKAAILAGGNGEASTIVDALGLENVGFIAPPSPADAQTKNAGIGGAGQALAISQTCENQDMAVKFLEFLASKEVHAELADHMSKLPLRTDVTAEELNIEAGSVYEQMYDAAQGYVFWVDNLLKPDVAAELMAMSAQVVIGQMTPEDLAKDLDGVAAAAE